MGTTRTSATDLAPLLHAMLHMTAFPNRVKPDISSATCEPSATTRQRPELAHHRHRCGPNPAVDPSQPVFQGRID